MATTKSMKIQAEIDKVKAKISEQQARLKRDRGHCAWYEHFPYGAPAAV